MSKSKNVMLNNLFLKLSFSVFLFTLFSVSASSEIEDYDAEIEKLIKAEQIEKEDLENLQQKSNREPPASQEPKVPCPHVPECTG